MKLNSFFFLQVFHHLPQLLLSNSMFKTEEFYVRRMHQLLTDFIVFMPLKVKELRNRADDAARNSMMHEAEGIQYNVPLQGQHFEYLLKSIAGAWVSSESLSCTFSQLTSIQACTRPLPT